MKKSELKSFGKPDEVRSFPNGRLELIHIGGATIGRCIFEPGWRWATSVQPIAKTKSCEAPHFQYHVSGVLRIRMDDGTEFDCKPGDVSLLPSGHDAWVVGNVEAPREPAPVALPEPTPPRTDSAPATSTRASAPAYPVVAPAAPSPDLLAGYGSSVSQLLARHLEYPRVAAMRGWEGTVTMRLEVGANGRLTEAHVDASSSHAALDTQALDMVRRIAELPPPPEDLRHREFTVLVPVVFRLQR